MTALTQPLAFEPLAPVLPANPPAAYQGGKRRLAARLCAMIADTPHDGYAEAFVGMGGVFLRRTVRPRIEVINDRAGEVANLFRILQRHYPQLMEVMRFQITSRAHYTRLAATPPESLTDLERAARFLYLQKVTFGGKVAGRTFGTDKYQGGRFNLTRLEPLLADVHERMAGVVIECLDWSDFIRRWDRPGRLFYFDPPYWGGENDYGKGLFDRSQFEAMADQLAGIRGSFVLSINDRPETREVFKRFQFEDVPCHYSIGGGKGKAVSELIVRGGR